MRTVKYWLLSLLLGSPAAFPLSGNLVASDNVKAHLISEVSAIAPGQSFWVALEFNIRDGWHTYWRNPGDSGQATALKWQLPQGFTAGDIVWTTPHRFEIPPLMNYGYAKHAVHLVKITAPKDLKTGTPVALSAKASWLVCSDVCIPEEADLQLKLPVVGEMGPIDPANFVPGDHAASDRQTRLTDFDGWQARHSEDRDAHEDQQGGNETNGRQS